MTDKEFRKQIYDVMWGVGSNHGNFNDDDTLKRIQEFSDFRESVFELVFKVGSLDEDKDNDSKEEVRKDRLHRWALDNIS
mgnify:FL=1